MFSIIKNISDVLPAIEGRKEFVVMDKGDYIVIDYVYVDNVSFDDPIRLECRGLIFDKQTGKLVSRGLEKFFNYGEKDTYNTIDWSQNHYVTDKRDGSMVRAFILNDEVRFGTRAGITEHSIKAEQRHLSDGLKEILRVVIENGMTPIFEWTSPQNRIVLNYDEDELRLLAIRNMNDGNYRSWEEVENLAKNCGLRTVDKFDMKLDKDSIFKFREIAKGVEGFVVFFPETGIHIKIKTDEYSKMHRAVSFLDRENMILPIVLDGLQDDILPALSPENQKRVLDYASAVNQQLQTDIWLIDHFITTFINPLETRKEKALLIQEHVKLKEYWPVYFRALDNGNIEQTLKSIYLKKPELLNTRWK